MFNIVAFKYPGTGRFVVKPTQLILALGVLAIGGAASAQEPAWTVEGRIGVVSDYRDRGYTLSNEDPSLQGEVTVSHASGVYAGVWASTIEEYGVGPDGDGAEVEVTLYSGWAGVLAGFDIDVGVWQNIYPDGDEVNYVEFPVQAGRTFGETTFSAGVIWAPSQTGVGDQANTYVWTRADFAPESWPIGLHATIGHEDGGFAPDGNTDWRLGLEAPMGDLTLGVDWVDSDTEDSAVVGRVFWNF